MANDNVNMGPKNFADGSFEIICDAELNHSVYCDPSNDVHLEIDYSNATVEDDNYILKDYESDIDVGNKWDWWNSERFNPLKVEIFYSSLGPIQRDVISKASDFLLFLKDNNNGLYRLAVDLIKVGQFNDINSFMNSLGKTLVMASGKNFDAVDKLLEELRGKVKDLPEDKQKRVEGFLTQLQGIINFLKKGVCCNADPKQAIAYDACVDKDAGKVKDDAYKGCEDQMPAVQKVLNASRRRSPTGAKADSADSNAGAGSTDECDRYDKAMQRAACKAQRDGNKGKKSEAPVSADACDNYSTAMQKAACRAQQGNK